VWFIAIGMVGLRQIGRVPAVLWALSPTHAVSFLSSHGWRAFLVLGSVVLAVTGVEALYADMGHFGIRAIRRTWYMLVLPGLLLNYLGQGAVLLENPAAAASLFYAAVPRWALYPMVVLATAATVIASQAVISGVFSLNRQAVMLGYWPRVRVEHTSPTLRGQIYVPSANWALMVATILLVLQFQKSTRLASAYGVAVTATMTITTLLAFVVTRRLWRWPLWASLAITAVCLTVDAGFLGATLVKTPAGGWLPLAIAAAFYLLMSTWRLGRETVGARVRAMLVPVAEFYEVMNVERPTRVPGTAVFMTSNLKGTPLALVQTLMHNRVVHRRVILLTVCVVDTARVAPEDRFHVEELEEGFMRAEVRCGFMEHPDVPRLLSDHFPDFAPEQTTYFLGREALLGTQGSGSSWRFRLFAAMSRNATTATDFFNIPPHRVLEIGTQLEVDAGPEGDAPPPA
jgi:KUP system potassium uptake protein